MAGASLYAALLGFTPGIAQAQVGSTTDIITGKVVGPDGAGRSPAPPSPRRRSIRTSAGRGRRSADGRYTIVFPDGGGQYQLQIRSLGFNPANTLLSRQADEDRLIANVTLSSGVATLSTVVTRGNRVRGPDPANAGGTGIQLSPSQLEKLPVDASDLATLATLAPGVVGISATDTTATAFSVAGQRQSLNSTTVDGATFAGSTVPQDAVRGTRVITNTYDVSRGQFTGGQIATTTRGGTNDVYGVVWQRSRGGPTRFAFGAQGPPAFGQLRNQYQLSGGIGGLHHQGQAVHLHRRTGRRAIRQPGLAPERRPGDTRPARHLRRYRGPIHCQGPATRGPGHAPQRSERSRDSLGRPLPTLRLPAERR